MPPAATSCRCSRACKDTLKADLSLCHLEVPLGKKDGPFFGYPSFLAPPEVAKGLVDVGYDSCSTASNHTLDRGVSAIQTTLDAMDAVGLHHTGSFRTPEESAAPLILDAGGVKVAQLSFTYGFNGIPLPQPWRANQINAAKILADARNARDAGAEVVVLSVQWGNEYQHAATADQKALARQLLADPALDLIIGTHVHVVQPFEKIGNKWVAYGLGQRGRPACRAARCHRGRCDRAVQVRAGSGGLGRRRGRVHADAGRAGATDPAGGPVAGACLAPGGPRRSLGRVES